MSIYLSYFFKKKKKKIVMPVHNQRKASLEMIMVLVLWEIKFKNEKGIPFLLMGTFLLLDAM